MQYISISKDLVCNIFGLFHIFSSHLQYFWLVSYFSKLIINLCKIAYTQWLKIYTTAIFNVFYDFKNMLDDIVFYEHCCIFCILGHSHRPSSTNSFDRRIYAIASHDGHLWYSDTNAT